MESRRFTVMATGIELLNWQMTGLLLGGLLWGVLGDKRGRVSVLFGSIFLYSTANLLNSFVTGLLAYKILRFLAGLGLAGELGAAITLVSEILPQKSRGYGATIVAGVGLSGSVAAALIGENFSWRTCYLIGSILGYLLLFLRFRIRDSLMFGKVKGDRAIERGNLKMIFGDRVRIIKFLRLVLIGVPIWFVGGLLVTFAPEFASALHVVGEVTAPRAIYFTYIGVATGDLLCGVLSQYFANRKKVLGAFLFLEAVLVYFYLYSPGISAQRFYATCFGLGFATGYWAVLMMMSAEHFGTNLRATVTTSVPNLIRGSVVIMTLYFRLLTGSTEVIQSATIVGASVVAISLIALYLSEETFDKDLNFVER